MSIFLIIFSLFISDCRAGLPEALEFLVKQKGADGYLVEVDPNVFSKHLKEYNSAQEFVKHHFETQIFHLQPVMGGSSGTDVYDIKEVDGVSSIGVLKVFRSYSNFAEALIAQNMLDGLKLKEFKHVSLFDIGKTTQEGRPMILEESARGKTIQGWIADVAGQNDMSLRAEKQRHLVEAVRKVALALSELHSKGEGISESSAWRRVYFDHLITKINLLGPFLPCLTELTESMGAMHAGLKTRKFDPQDMLSVAHDRGEQCAQNSMKVGVLIHGDTAPANMLFDEKTEVLTFIDNGTLSRSLNRENRTHANPSFDTANFLRKVRADGMAYGLEIEEIEELEGVFLRTYQFQGKPLDPNEPCYQYYSWFSSLTSWVRSFIGFSRLDITISDKEIYRNGILRRMEEIGKFLNPKSN